MSKLFAITCIAALLGMPEMAHAQHHRGGHHHHHHHHHGGGHWVGPAVGGLALGAIIGGALAAPRVYHAPPPAYYAPPPAYYAPPAYLAPAVHCRRLYMGYDAWGRQMVQEVCQ